MRYVVRHCTTYDYAEPVTLSHNIVRLRPRNLSSQECLQHHVRITPSPEARTEWIDHFGNHTDYFCLKQNHRQLTIATESEVEVVGPASRDLSIGASWEQVRDLLRNPVDMDTRAAREFCFDSTYVSRSSELASFASSCFAPGKPLGQCCLDLTELINREFEYSPGSTAVGTPVREVLRARRGVCQDFAHLQIVCLRSLGLAARYVSGYLVTNPPPGRRRLRGADVSHAWASVFVPEIGWIDFDPTNGVMPSDGHVSVAWARDYEDVGPIRGILVGGRRQALHVSVDVAPLDPPPTPPLALCILQ